MGKAVWGEGEGIGLRDFFHNSLFFAKAKITVALLNFVVAEQDSKNEILLGRILVKRLVTNVFNNLDALFRAKKYVDFGGRNLTCEIINSRKS